MKCLIILSIPGIALAVICAYYLSVPTIPEKVEQPWIPRVHFAVQAFVRHMSSFYGVVTGHDPELLTQSADRFLQSMGRGRVQEGVNVTWDMIVGVPVYVYTPETKGTSRPAVIYLHGGSFFTGSVYGPNRLCSIIAKENDAVVYNVDYSKLLYRPNTGPLEDVYAVAIQLLTNGAKRGVDSKRVVVAGDGAGGTLAAALTLKLRDFSVQPPLVGQMLIYPFLQALDFHTPSRQNEHKYPGFAETRSHIANMVRMYVNAWPEYMENMHNNTHISAAGVKANSALIELNFLPTGKVPANYKPYKTKHPTNMIAAWFEKRILDPFYFPLMANDTSNLPPAFVLTVEGDSYYDDGAIYAKRLELAGNDVTYIHESRGWHGMMYQMAWPMKSRLAEEYANVTAEFVKTCFRQK